MDQVKTRLRNLSVLHTFILCMMVFTLLAMVLVETENTLLVTQQKEIAFRYLDIVEGYNSKKVWYKDSNFLLSEKDSSFMKIYEILIWILPSVTYLVCIVAAGLIFYNKKLKQPILLINSATQKIACNNLDFTLDYDRQDEMGEVCVSFEKMRYALKENNQEMWRQMEERKRLNAAFSHDLRTPLTVLSGHLDILKKYLPDGNISMDDMLDTFMVMDEQVTRLKNYVISMNTLQRLEDIPIQKKGFESKYFIETLKDTAKIVCASKKLVFKNECKSSILNIDTEIAMQVYENILSNAIRYTNSTISVSCKCTTTTFSICITDDGCGFDKKSLKAATDPFYSTDKKNSEQHFGLGLNISKILCERHGGQILLENKSNGGAVVQADFSMVNNN